MPTHRVSHSVSEKRGEKNRSVYNENLSRAYTFSCVLTECGEQRTRELKIPLFLCIEHNTNSVFSTYVSLFCLISEHFVFQHNSFRVDWPHLFHDEMKEEKKRILRKEKKIK